MGFLNSISHCRRRDVRHQTINCHHHLERYFGSQIKIQNLISAVQGAGASKNRTANIRARKLKHEEHVVAHWRPGRRLRNQSWRYESVASWIESEVCVICGGRAQAMKTTKVFAETGDTNRESFLCGLKIGPQHRAGTVKATRSYRRTK